MLTRPAATVRLGDAAAANAALFGLNVEDWQRFALDTGIALNGEWWAASDVGVWVPRQNGKGGVIEALVLFHQFILRTPVIIWSAHNTDIAAKAYRRYVTLLKRNPALWSLVTLNHKGVGMQRLEVLDGASTVTWNTRSTSGLRGDTVDLLVLDEAQELNDDHMAAISPTLGARSLVKPGVQTWYFGTPPRDPFAWVYGLRDAGESRAAGYAWLDWGLAPDLDRAGNVPAGFMDDPANHAAANPAYQVRIGADFLTAQRHKLGQRFANEHLGVWPPGATTERSPIPAEVWAGLEHPAPLPTVQPAVLAFDMHAGRWAICLAARMENDRDVIGVELLAEGVSEVAALATLTELAASTRASAVIVDPYSQADALLADVSRLPGFRRADAADVVAAWGRFVIDARERRLAHNGDGRIASALSDVVVRAVGARSVPHRQASGETVSTAIAAALAAWGIRDSPKDNGPAIFFT